MLHPQGHCEREYWKEEINHRVFQNFQTVLQEKEECSWSLLSYPGCSVLVSL